MNEERRAAPALAKSPAPPLPRSPTPLRPRLFIAAGLFLASLALYTATLAPSVVTLFDDSLEFQLVTYQLGIAHPTGYPLYTLLGKLFTFLPVSNVAYRVNLMSAFFGAATVALLYLLIIQLALPNRANERMAKQKHSPFAHSSFALHLGAIIGATLFAFSPIFWQQATIAEVYTLNAFFVVAILLLTISRPLAPPQPTNPSTAYRLPSTVYWLAGLVGLSLTHHRTMVLLLPALALYFYLSQKPGFLKKPGFYRGILWAGLIGLTPLLLYLYLPLRGPIGSLDGTYENTWAGFWRQISAGGYGVFLFGNPFNQQRDLGFYWMLFTSQFYTLIPGFLGLIYLGWRGQRRYLALSGVAFLTYLIFNLFYQVADIEVFFIPTFIIWAAWSGVGLVAVLTVITLKVQRWPLKVMAVGIILLLFGVMVGQSIGQTGPTLAARNTWQIHDYGLDMLQQPLPSNSAIVGIVGEMTLLRYFQQTEQRRPDVETLAADKEPERLAAVEKLLSAGKAVYLTRELPGAAERWSLGAEGPLIQVNPQPVMTPPPMDKTVNQPVMPEITLLGYSLSHPPHTGDGLPPLRLTLFWQTVAPVTANLKVSARLLDPSGEVTAAADAIPVHFSYPTPAWRPGEVVADVYDLTSPAAGQYTPLLIWYDPAQGAAEVGRVQLEPIIISVGP